MPRINYITTKANKRSKALETLKGIPRLFRVECPTCRQFADAIGVSPATAWKRLEFPAEMTLEELITASINLGYTGSVKIQRDGLTAEVTW